MLELVASRSTCIRRAVGAIITDKDGHVLSTGYNGVPKDFDHCTDLPCLGAKDKPGDTSNCMAVHAEQNALLQCSNLLSAHTIYCTMSPCFVCAKLIANTNIEQIICVDSYSDIRGLKVLMDRGCIINVNGKDFRETWNDIVREANEKTLIE
jgi:dCMP deaminase